MKIICIGKNYVKHIKELNGSSDDNPTVFMKPDSSIIQKNQPFFIPEFSDEIHYELELILKFSKVKWCICSWDVYSNGSDCSKTGWF